MARRTLQGDVQVRREAQEEGEAHQEWVPVAQVVADLESRVLSLGLVEESLTETTPPGAWSTRSWPGPAPSPTARSPGVTSGRTRRCRASTP